GLIGRWMFARFSSASMRSWVIGSASRPHGFGQWGTTYPASARSLPLGSGWAASQARTSSRRGSSSGASSRSMGRNYRTSPQNIATGSTPGYGCPMAGTTGRVAAKRAAARSVPGNGRAPDENSLTPKQSDRRRRVIEAAISLATKGGYDAVQMRDVAAEARVALGTLYRYF